MNTAQAASKPDFAEYPDLACCVHSYRLPLSEVVDGADYHLYSWSMLLIQYLKRIAHDYVLDHGSLDYHQCPHERDHWAVLLDLS